jgi:hypothetical protein
VVNNGTRTKNKKRKSATHHELDTHLTGIQENVLRLEIFVYNVQHVHSAECARDLQSDLREGVGRDAIRMRVARKATLNIQPTSRNASCVFTASNDADNATVQRKRSTRHRS